MQTMRTATVAFPHAACSCGNLLNYRPAEAAESRWEEVDMEAREWKTSSRMKMNRDHTARLQMKPSLF